MLQGEYSAILSTFIKLPFVIKIFVLSIFELLFYTRKIPGGAGEFVVGAESFQIIWVIGVRPNLITWVVVVSLRGRGRKNIICQKKREVLSNITKKPVEHSKPQRRRPFLFMPNHQNSDVSVEYW